MAVLGELGIERVEDLVVVESEDLALEIGTLLGGELVEPAQVEAHVLAVSVIPTEGGEGVVVGVSLDGLRGEVHGG